MLPGPLPVKVHQEGHEQRPPRLPAHVRPAAAAAAVAAVEAAALLALVVWQCCGRTQQTASVPGLSSLSRPFFRHKHTDSINPNTY